jgi:hypothetical protein
LIWQAAKGAGSIALAAAAKLDLNNPPAKKCAPEKALPAAALRSCTGKESQLTGHLSA